MEIGRPRGHTAGSVDRFNALLLLALLCPGCRAAAEPSRETPAASEPRRLALGTMGTGGLLRLHATPAWAAELRVQGGSEDSQDGDVRATVFSLRGYRFFPERYRCRLYLGGEGAYTKTSLTDVQSGSPGSSPLLKQQGFGNTSGVAVGLFGGLEYAVLRRVFIDVDAGPYAISLKESQTGTSGSSWDLVLSAAVGVYLF